MRFLLTAGLLAAWAVPAAFSDVPCRVSTLMCWRGAPGGENPRLRLDTDEAVGELDCPLGYNEAATAAFDLREGSLTVFADAPDPTVGGVSVQGDVSDTYVLVGHSDPDEVHHFQALFTIDMNHPVSWVEAHVRQGIGDDAPADTFTCWTSCVSTKAYDLSKRVGEPFSFTFGMTAWDQWEYRAKGTMAISFAGLVGLQVGSCHGYHGLTTPAASTTWGSIKSRYR